MIESTISTTNKYGIKSNLCGVYKITLGEAGRWIKENTKYKSKNPVSKIKAVCDGERPTAFGYKWRYKKGQETN